MHQGTSRFANMTASSETPSWNTTQPTGTAQDAGAMYGAFRPYEVATGESNSAFRPTFSGTYTGVLDNIAVTAFIANPVYQRTGTNPTNYYKLDIDGQTVWENATSADEEVETPITAVDDNVGHIDFAFVGLYDALKARGVANTDTTTHTITLSFINKYYGDGNFMMFYDSAEYPSGVDFNLEDGPLSGYVPMDATWLL
jgi:hypothetical protein